MTISVDMDDFMMDPLLLKTGAKSFFYAALYVPHPPLLPLIA
jgi:hypothetical protein